MKRKQMQVWAAIGVVGLVVVCLSGGVFLGKKSFSSDALTATSELPVSSSGSGAGTPSVAADTPTITPIPPTFTPSPTLAPTFTHVPTRTPVPSTLTGTVEVSGPNPSPRSAAVDDTLPATSTPSPRSTHTPEPSVTSPTPTSRSGSATPSTTPALAPTELPTLPPPTARAKASVSGRVVNDGETASGIAVSLENQAYAVVATASTDARGFYTFDNLTVFGTGFNVLFTQEQNEQYDVGEVASWAWLGPITLSGGKAVELPDFEIGLHGLEQNSPVSGASFSTGDISRQAPLTFAWEPYVGASTYWVDLMQGDELITVWQSPLVSATSVAFDGTLDDGDHIAAGTYWWGVGARKSVGSYHLTVYGYLPALVITP